MCSITSFKLLTMHVLHGHMDAVYNAVLTVEREEAKKNDKKLGYTRNTRRVQFKSTGLY